MWLQLSFAEAGNCNPGCNKLAQVSARFAQSYDATTHA